MYTVKSGYWVARNILNKEMVETQGELSITKLQAFFWKIKAPPKQRHFIWQTISGQLAVSSNLTHRHMRCDNHGPRCGADDETINHAIFDATNMGTCSNPNSAINVPQREPLHEYRLSFLEEECYRRS
uniref:Reverse transcriptase zinc-binding domain-containing protein n=1 Tax=Brassica oleracea TaxID=3712 RepID=A0A3P6G5F8_BRAOL|nr:unnamed protein product [Brassica oleracea]